ncbi:uncharacterized protein DUF1772 [Stackebrandtia albiflava]|uniref:Uncharacterized protein DUF1772 n=1 Tax=Stackebrandtia albiflava TaxID=406432 RepID=A0A562V243_9ACTN|nr:DUF1772 domain-containing protein [Stackebrandtia albiflava]TWJ11931.1 uncharacterized protein DUF1772 [Stackebrandtia albiflava]
MNTIAERAGFTAPAVFTWVAMLGFGGIAVETIVIYPNVFHDAPASLTLATEFFSVTGPADFFPPMGAATIVACLVALVAAWRVAPARYWLLAALGSLVVGEFLFSMVYFWPRNDIMFEEGIAVHTAAFLQATADEFQTGHWFRLAMSGFTATAGFVAALKAHRRLVEKGAERVAQAV